jgi:hypothetical protein
MAWRFVGACFDGQEFMLEGENVWKHKWTHDKILKAEVVDPHYGQTFQFTIWEIRVEGRAIRFAAGEFSNCVWGFYQES